MPSGKKKASPGTEKKQLTKEEIVRPKYKTPREKQFIKNVVKTGQIGKAALMSGYSNISYGSYLIRQPRIASAILREMERQGITDEYLASKLKEGLEATYPKRYSSKGALIQDNEPDFFTRSLYWEKAAKVRGDFAPEKHETTEKKIVIVITPQMVKGLIESEVLDKKEVLELCKIQSDGQETYTLKEEKNGQKETAESLEEG